MSVNQRALEETIARYGGPKDLSLATQVVAGETMQTVRVAWHPWFPMDNLCATGFKFKIPYVKLERLQPILIPVLPDVKIKPRRNALGFVGNIAGQAGLSEGGHAEGFGMAVPAQRAGSYVEHVNKMPSTTARELQTAYKKFGLVISNSLRSDGNEELTLKMSLYQAIFETPFEGGKGRTAQNLILDNWPAFLEFGAPELLKKALKDGVKDNGKLVRLPDSYLTTGEQLIREISLGIEQERDAALNESSGVLPNTKKDLEIAAKGGQGKFFLDPLDRFLLREHPSFNMDTEIERAQKANESALEKGQETAQATNSALLTLAEQNSESLKQNSEVLKELAESRKLMMKMLEKKGS